MDRLSWLLVLAAAAILMIILIQPPPLPEPDFSWTPAQPQVGQSVVFTARVYDPKQLITEYTWTLGDGSWGNFVSVRHQYGTAGTYRVCLRIRDSRKRSNEVCKNILVTAPPPPPAPPTPPPPPSVISRDNNRHPTWSPDGKVIMFVSDRDGNTELYTVNLDTLVNTRVTNNSALDIEPAWGKDGRIAFVSNRDNQTGTDIYILDYATGGTTRATFDPGNRNQRPSWAAIAGRLAHLVYHTDIDGNREIYRRDPLTGNANRIMLSPADDWNANVSPDGTKVAYQHLKDGRSQIYVMDIDGRRIRQITFNVGENVDPAWSPDSKQIAFASNRDGNFKVYVIDPETLSERLLTNDTFNSLHPAWSPDGAKIAFETDRTGNWEIWLMDAGGQDLKRITGVSK